MNKRGQIFLAAALILAILLLSFGVIYNSARASKSDRRIADLAKEIKYEGLKTIDYSVKEVKTYDQAKSLLDSLLSNYSGANPDLIIYGWFYSPSESRESEFFYDKGKASAPPDSLNSTKSSNSKYLIIRWNESDINIYYNLSLNNKAHNFNVLIERGEGNERIIAAQ